MDEPRDTPVELAEDPGNEGRESGREVDALSHFVESSLQGVLQSVDDILHGGGSQDVAAETSTPAQESPSTHDAENYSQQSSSRELHVTEPENVSDSSDTEDEYRDFIASFNTNPHVLEDNVDNVDRRSFSPIVRGIPPLVDIGMPDDIPDIFWDNDVDDFVVVSYRAREISESLPYVVVTNLETTSPVDGLDQSGVSSEAPNQAFSSGSRVHPVRQNLANSMRQHGNTLIFEQMDPFRQVETTVPRVDPDSRDMIGEPEQESQSGVSPAAADRMEEYIRQDPLPSFERPRSEFSLESSGAGIQNESMSNNIVMDGPGADGSDKKPPSDIFEMCNDEEVNASNTDEQGHCESESQGSSMSDFAASTSNDSSPSEQDVPHSASTMDALKRVLEEIIPAQSNPPHSRGKGEITKTPYPSLYSEAPEEAPSSENTIDDDGDADVENVADAEFDFQSVSPACPETVVVARERTDADADALLNRVINEEPDDCLRANEYGFKLMGVGGNSSHEIPVTSGQETNVNHKYPSVEDIDVSLHNLCAVQSSKATKVDVLNELQGTERGNDLKVREISQERLEPDGMKVTHDGVITKKEVSSSSYTNSTEEFEEQRATEIEQKLPALASEETVDGEAVCKTNPQNNTILETNEQLGDKAVSTANSVSHVFQEKDQNSYHVVDQESIQNIAGIATKQCARTPSYSAPTFDSASSGASPKKTNISQANDNNDTEAHMDTREDKSVPETPNNHTVDHLNSGDGQRTELSHATSNLNASRIILEATDLWMSESEKMQSVKEIKKLRTKSLATKVSQLLIGSSARPVAEHRHQPYLLPSPKSDLKSRRINASHREHAGSVPRKIPDAESLETSTTKAKPDSPRFSRPGSIKFRRGGLGSVKHAAAITPSTTACRETGQRPCGRDKASTTLPTVKPRPEKASKNTEKFAKESKTYSCDEQIPENLINHGVHQPQSRPAGEECSVEDNSMSRCPARRCTPNMSDVSETRHIRSRKLSNSRRECANESHFGNETSSTTVSSLFSTLSTSFGEAKYQRDRYEQQETLPPCPANQRMMFGPALQKSKVESYKLYIPKKHLKPAETSAEEYHRYKMDLRMSENLSKVRPTVDCHIDPRLIKKRPYSKDRERYPQRVRDNSLLTMENVKFLEVLKYKRSNYTQNEHITGCKTIMRPIDGVTDANTNTFKNNLSSTVNQRHVKGRPMDRSADKTCTDRRAVDNGPHPGSSMKAKMDRKRQELPVWKTTKSRV